MSQSQADHTVVILAFGLVLASGPAAGAALPAPELAPVHPPEALTLEATSFEVGEESLAGDKGVLRVPEDRRQSGSRNIELPVVRVRARGGEAGAPIFLFEGGPGISNVKMENLPLWLLDRHDLVRVGYRGVDGSVSLASTDLSDAFKSARRPLSSEGLKQASETIVRVAEQFREQGIAVEAYGITDVVEDVEAARKALGYARINLSAGSYGAAVAYGYLQRYPDHVGRVLLSEPAFPANLGAAEPEGLDRRLERLNEQWKQDAWARTRSEDIVATIRRVLGQLPKTWNGIEIDPGSVRLVTYFCLYTRDNTARAFDAYAAADQGDWSGIAFMSVYWDQVVGWFNWGDMISKTVCTRSGPERDWEKEMDPPGSILGSPLAKLAWGGVKYGSWPTRGLPADLQAGRSSAVETLFVFGSEHAARVAEENVAPFSGGRTVVLEDLGHLDLGAVGAEGLHTLEQRYFDEGVVDTAPLAAAKPEPRVFEPQGTFQDMARQMLGGGAPAQ